MRVALVLCSVPEPSIIGESRQLGSAKGPGLVNRDKALNPEVNEMLWSLWGKSDTSGVPEPRDRRCF